MSYELAVAIPAAPSWRALRDAVGLADLRVLPEEPAGDAWPAGGLRLCRVGLSTRVTEVAWDSGKLTVSIAALPSPEDCDLGLRVAEAAARLAGAATIHTDYFEEVAVGDLRRWHNAEWVREQAESVVQTLATLVRERGPVEMPGPNRPCVIGARLLGELEAAGPSASLAERVVVTMRRVQWAVPPGFRDAGVFASSGGGNGGGGRETHFAVWTPGVDLLLPSVDYVALRVTDGEIVMVPFAAVAALAGKHGTLIDEVQLLVSAVGEAEWPDVIARARAVAVNARR